MASGLERVPDNLKKQLAIAVRSIQWSYAIFWSISATQPGVLEWGDGYYNGDIKTRKTVQSIEVNPDQLGLQRSEQLRELYESLSMAETSPQARRPSAALSPDDLTDTEWYYLVCMSFTFSTGQGLPGRSLASGLPVWLSNAQYADSKVFSRSLLAKSAAIQTVVCFPYMRGVIELGVTDMVLEDPSLIHHIKTSFLDIPYSAVAKSGTISDQQVDFAAFNNDIADDELVPALAYEDLEITSPNISDFQAAEDSFMVEGINGVASQVQSWQFMDDDFSNCVHHSVNSSDCVSHAVVDPVRGFPGSNESKVDKSLKDVQEFNHSKLSALDLQKDDLHYQSVLSSLLKYSHPLILGPNFRNCHQGSSFSSWKKAGLMHSRKLKGGSSQEMLRKILTEVPQMHDRGLLELPEDDDYGAGNCRTPEADGIATSHVLSERRRREKMNEKFMILKSIIPSISKVDKVTILDDTIQYLQQLERRVEVLESQREFAELEVQTKRRPQDSAERTSDNYCSIKTGNVKRPPLNKRKADDIDEADQKSDSADNITIDMNDKEVIIEIKCPWRDGRLVEIMDALSQLHMDSYSVRSSNTEGILSLTIKSKHTGLTSISAGTIRKTLQKVAWKC